MGQDDIFKLLLIILLLTNERDCCDSQNPRSGFCNINEVIIVVLLLNACSGNFFNNSDTDTLPVNTTF